MHPFPDRQELQARIAAVRAAKDAKARAGKGRDLTLEELDVILPTGPKAARKRVEWRRQWA